MEQWLHCGGVSSSRRLCGGRNWWQSIVSWEFCLEVVYSVCVGGGGVGGGLLWGMGRARGGFGRTYRQGCFSFCRVGRGGRLCNGTQVMASQGFWSSQWDQWCLSMCDTYCIPIWMSDAALSPPCEWGVLLWGLTSALYTAVLRDWDDTQTLHFRTASVEFALLVMCDTLTSHLRLHDLVTPKYLTLSTTSSVCPCST